MRQPLRARKPRPKTISLKKVFLLVLVVCGLGAAAAWLAAPRAEVAEALTGRIGSGEQAAPADPRPQPGFAGGASVTRILQSVLKLWVEAMVSGDYRSFYLSLAPSWKAKDSPESLRDAYMNLTSYRDVLSQYPGRGKLVLLESAPYDPYEPDKRTKSVRDSVGPESPWLIRGEWRTGKTTLNITLILSEEAGEWKPVGLRLEVYDGTV
jgi:hypothetical protein